MRLVGEHDAPLGKGGGHDSPLRKGWFPLRGGTLFGKYFFGVVNTKLLFWQFLQNQWEPESLSGHVFLSFVSRMDVEREGS